MVYDTDLKSQATRLRKLGYSLQEISTKLKVAKSTASLWVRSVALNAKATKKIEEKKIKSRLKGANTIRKKYKAKQEFARNEAVNSLKQVILNKDTMKLLCAVLYWAEGVKHTHTLVTFVNSDPVMISTFLALFRKAFIIDESKLRGLVHVHEYHNELETKKYWSEITKIPTNQFQKSYLKPHTKKRIREGYKGTISIRYYDARIARELYSIYNTFAQSVSR